MSITIYASDKTTLKYTLPAVQASRLHQSLNGECTFDLTMPGRLIKDIAVGDEIRLGNLYFDVVRVGKSAQAQGVAYSISCEHISYELADMTQDAVHFSGTPADVLATILDGTGFSVGTVTVTGEWSITINQETNKRDALQQWALACSAELSYTDRSVNFLAHTGSSTPVVLSEKENVKTLAVTLDSRSDTQTYSIELSRLQHLSLGDAVTINYSSLNINTTTRVITLDYDPFHPMAISMTTGDYVPNFTNAVTAALEARVSEGVPYYGVTIDKETGIKIARSDGKSEAIFNSSLFTMRGKIDGIMKDQIYFDPESGRYIFDGALGADAIFTDSLYAETGDVSELTVDRLSTSRRIRKYILGDTSDDNYIRIQDQYIQLISATLKREVPLITESNYALISETDIALLTEAESSAGEIAPPTQAVNRYNQPLYWQKEPVGHTASGYPTDINGDQIYATTDVTSWPVYTYTYNELIKSQLAFDNMGGVNYIPTLILGVGNGAGLLQGFIRKAENELQIWYQNAQNQQRGIFMGEYTDIVGLRQTTQMDFSMWDYGQFSETIDGGNVNSYFVQFDDQARPVMIRDAQGHSTEVIW